MQYEVRELYGEKNKHTGNVTLNRKGEATISFPRVHMRAPIKLKRARVEYITTHGMIISGIEDPEQTQNPAPLYQEWECRYQKEEQL